MHDYFADWYTDAGVIPVAEKLGCRWAAVEHLLENLDGGTVVELVSFATGIDPDSPGEPGSLRSACKEEDATFPMRGALNELGVLASAVLIANAEAAQPDRLGVLAALAAGSIRPPAVGDLSVAAASASAQLSVRDRVLPKKPETLRISWSTASKEPLEQLRGISNHNQIPQLVQALGSAFDAVGDAMEKLRTAENRLANYATGLESVLSEEAQLYWWVLNQQQNTEGFGPTDLSSLAADFTRLTRFHSEHPAAAELLGAVRLADGEVTPCDLGLGSEEIPTPFVLTPLHHLGNGAEPPAVWSKDAASLSLAASEALVQLHREKLLFHLWST